MPCITEQQLFKLQQRFGRMEGCKGKPDSLGSRNPPPNNQCAVWVCDNCGNENPDALEGCENSGTWGCGGTNPRVLEELMEDQRVATANWDLKKGATRNEVKQSFRCSLVSPASSD